MSGAGLEVEQADSLEVQEAQGAGKPFHQHHHIMPLLQPASHPVSPCQADFGLPRCWCTSWQHAGHDGERHHRVPLAMPRQCSHASPACQLVLDGAKRQRPRDAAPLQQLRLLLLLSALPLPLLLRLGQGGGGRRGGRSAGPVLCQRLLQVELAPTLATQRSGNALLCPPLLPLLVQIWGPRLDRHRGSGRDRPLRRVLVDNRRDVLTLAAMQEVEVPIERFGAAACKQGCTRATHR